MLKAQFPFSIPFTFFSVIMCMGIIGFLGISVMNQATIFAEFADSGIDELASVDAANMIEGCFSNGNGLIELDFLMSNEDTAVCDIEACGLCEIDVGVKIADIEKESGKKQWSFGFDQSKGTDHEIFINIKDGTAVHVGKMYVQVV